MSRLTDLYPHVLGHITTIEATYDICRMAIERGIPGDFVECGVYAGAQSAAMARAIMDYEALTGTRYALNDSGKRVHLFDSFSGFPEFGEHDEQLAAGGWKAGDTAVSLDDVRANMKRWGIPDELLVYHQGWLEDTVPSAVREEGRFARHNWLARISVLRLDADLYESTKICMEQLYPLVSPGGWVIVDDWNLDGCRKAVTEFVVPAPIMWRIPNK